MSKRIGCKYCNFKGYTKHSFHTGSLDDESVSVAICSYCKDSRGYYAYVRSKYGTLSKPQAQILNFLEFKQKRKKEKSE